MTYRGLLAFIFILLLGIPTGANNLLRSRERSHNFSSRNAYCESLKQKTEIPQENQSIPYSYLPATIKQPLQRTQWHAQNNLEQVKQLLTVLSKEKSELALNPSHNEQERKYQSWRLEHEIPQQLILLEERKRLLEQEMENMQQHRLTEKTLLTLYEQTFHQDFEAIRSSHWRQIAQVNTLPAMGIEIELEEKFFHKSIKLYPIWIEGNQTVRASEEPYLTLSQTMIPDVFNNQFNINPLRDFFIKQSGIETKIPDEHHLVLHKNASRNQISNDWVKNQFTGLSDPAIRNFFDLDCQHQRQ